MMHLHSDSLLLPALVVHGQRVPPTSAPSHAVLAGSVRSHQSGAEGTWGGKKWRASRAEPTESQGGSGTSV